MKQTAKEKGLEVIGKWVRAVHNHIYWAATSTTCEFGKLIAAKWSSFIWHVADKHKNHSDNLFPNCIHGNLCENREWIHIGNSIKFCTNRFEICCVIPTTFQILLDEVARIFKVLPISAYLIHHWHVNRPFQEEITGGQKEPLQIDLACRMSNVTCLQTMLASILLHIHDPVIFSIISEHFPVQK